MFGDSPWREGGHELNVGEEHSDDLKWNDWIELDTFEDLLENLCLRT